jgi:hypothetical protein
MAYLILAGRAMLAIVFVASAFSKLRSRKALLEFGDSIRALKLVPRGLTNVAAATVALAEAAAAVLLVVPATQAAGGALGAALLAVFTGVIGYALARGTRVTCRCFGASGAEFGRHHLVRNLVLLAAALTVLVGTDAAPDKPADAVLALVLGGTAAICAVRWDDLRAILLRSLEV